MYLPMNYYVTALINASNVYETEISLLLKNCSTKEICFIHDLVKNTLISLHNRNLK